MKNRNLQIEGLRGIGLVCILVYHFFYRYDQIYHGTNTNEFLQVLPTIGVFLFCLISGLYIDHEDENGGLQWLAHRILKIWPTYFIVITIVFLITRFIELPGRTIQIADYLLNIPFINGFVGKPYVDEAHWYLTTLLACLFWLSIILRKIDFYKRQYVYLSWMIIVTALFLVRTKTSNTKIITLVLILLGGEYSLAIICGVFLGRIRASKLKLNVVGCFLGILCSVFVFGGIRAGILSACAILVYFADRKLIRIFENRLCSMLGRISLPIYLLHQNLGYLIIYSFEACGISAVGIPAVMACLFSIVVGSLLYRLSALP